MRSESVVLELMQIRKLTLVVPALIAVCVSDASALNVVRNGTNVSRRAGRQGKIVGHLYLAGGPHFLQKQHPKGLPGSDLKVLLTERSGRTVATSKVVATTITKRDGSFALRVAAGRYRIAGQLMTGQLCFTQSVVVRSGHQARVTLYCSIK
jgi:hypothetical protein